MRVFKILVMLLFVSMIIGCSKEIVSEDQMPQEPVVLKEFYIDASTQYGFNPDEIVIKNGAYLILRAYGGEKRITSDELDIDVTVPSEDEKRIEVRPANPGTYTLNCAGCPAEKSTLTFTAR
ncbi:hypothetical protein GOV07_01480 [Candidatus Woesearchaeota archaeon]|nr:hypothetical protein [Candidatus Woesearchaeota archaeon]